MLQINFHLVHSNSSHLVIDLNLNYWNNHFILWTPSAVTVTSGRCEPVQKSLVPLVWYDTLYSSLVWPGTLYSSLVWLDPLYSSLVWPGTLYSSLVWLDTLCW